MASDSDILVVLFLRGGCDGLNLLGPSSDPIYIAERRSETRVERDGDHKGLPIKNNFADSDFRFHFKAGKLKELYDAKHLAVIHACGLTNGTRSHFEAIDFMERGTPDNKTTTTGWLTRFSHEQKFKGMVPIISTSNSLPTSLLACPEAVAAPNVKRVTLQSGGHFKTIQEKLLNERYQGTDPIAINGLRTLAVADIFGKKIPLDAHGKQADYVPSAGVTYPTEGYTNELNNGLKALAQLIKMDIGVRIATVDYGGWDTHVDQEGRFANLTDALSRSLFAFWEDMKAYHDKMTVVVMSEFGRRLRSNESRGTDHGHGNMMMVLGSGVRGGEIYGQWPGLDNPHLDNQVDLAVTTDYRTVLSEVISTRFSKPMLNLVFPGFVYKPLGFMKA